MFEAEGRTKWRAFGEAYLGPGLGPALDCDRDDEEIMFNNIP